MALHALVGVASTGRSVLIRAELSAAVMQTGVSNPRRQGDGLFGPSRFFTSETTTAAVTGAA